jgi:hypothetical protein
MATLVQILLSSLDKLALVRRQGKGWSTRCPNPDHEDRHPSFFLYLGGGGRCFSTCNYYWPPQELAQLLRISLPADIETVGLTLSQLAQTGVLPEGAANDH